MAAINRCCNNKRAVDREEDHVSAGRYPILSQSAISRTTQKKPPKHRAAKYLWFGTWLMPGFPLSYWCNSVAFALTV
jgi:hypothetical protein